jgi:hypothetical protein
MNEKAKIVFDKMIERGIIPSEGVFEVTDEIMKLVWEIHREIFPPLRSRYPRTSEIKYSKKLAGLNLMKLNEQRFNEKSNTRVSKNKLKQNCGFVYVITNPSFPNSYKIGMTSNLDARLSTYQICDPNRSYKIEHYAFVMDRKKVEKDLLNNMNLNIIKGEWVNNEKVKELLISLQ